MLAGGGRSVKPARAAITRVPVLFSNMADETTPMAHQRPAQYRNPSGTDVSSAGVGRWTLQRLRDRLPRPPRASLAPVEPDVATLHANRTEPTLTWIGHASMLLQIGGLNVLIDPVFSWRVSPVSFAGPKRHQRPGLTVEQLPPIDVVCNSHSHYDHLDLPSMRAVAARHEPTYLVPNGTDVWLRRHVRADVHAIGFEWHEVQSVGNVEFHFLPVQHWSSRSPFRRNDTPWGSWAIIAPNFRFWFSGDLGYSDDPRQIGARFGPFDYAAIGIGAYAPRWFMRPQHIDPDEAVQVMLDVCAARAIGMHWGTFPLSDESLDEPPQELARALARRGLDADCFTVLRHGETRRLLAAAATPDSVRDTSAAADTP
jgi:L-ascorbate metabolism protein UlaG (beta-lactamase superfamily)